MRYINLKLTYLLTYSDNQFGFKKSSCTHAIYTLWSVVDYYVNNGFTVNMRFRYFEGVW